VYSAAGELLIDVIDRGGDVGEGRGEAVVTGLPDLVEGLGGGLSLSACLVQGRDLLGSRGEGRGGRGDGKLKGEGGDQREGMSAG
jgi:hypothetical protein